MSAAPAQCHVSRGDMRCSFSWNRGSDSLPMKFGIRIGVISKRIQSHAILALCGFHTDWSRGRFIRRLKRIPRWCRRARRRHQRAVPYVGRSAGGGTAASSKAAANSLTPSRKRDPCGLRRMGTSNTGRQRECYRPSPRSIAAEDRRPPTESGVLERSDIDLPPRPMGAFRSLLAVSCRHFAPRSKNQALNTESQPILSIQKALILKS